jgi:hypothetical protein
MRSEKLVINVIVKNIAVLDLWIGKEKNSNVLSFQTFYYFVSEDNERHLGL